VSGAPVGFNTITARARVCVPQKKSTNSLAFLKLFIHHQRRCLVIVIFPGGFKIYLKTTSSSYKDIL